jgi:hypothetical protein
LPEALVQEIEAESKSRKISTSDIVRERLQRTAGTPQRRPRRSSPSPISSARSIASQPI